MDRILGASADGGSVDEIDEALLPTGLAIDDDYVYWTALNRAHDWDVRRTPRRGGTSMLLSTVYVRPGAIAVDSTGVYWTNEFGGVAKASLQ